MDYFIQYWYFITGAVALVGCSGFFSGSEAAFFSLPRPQLRKLEREQKFLSQKIVKLLRKPHQLLTTILLSNLLINVGLITLMEVLARRTSSTLAGSVIDFSWLGFDTLPAGDVVHFGIMAGILFVIILLGEITPKVIATRFPLKVVKITCLPVSFVRIILLLPVWMATHINYLIQKMFFGGKIKQDYLSAGELQDMIRNTGQQGFLGTDEQEFMIEAIDLSDLTARETMIPRVDMHTFDLTKSREDFLDLAKQSHRSKIPVYEENLDDVQGYLDVKDVILNKECSLKDLVKKFVYYPETKKADQLLLALKENDQDLAIIVDEYGGTAGMITRHGLLEFILGEIGDEYDPKQPKVIKLKEKHYRIPGRLLLHHWRDFFDFELPESEADTLNGYLVEKLGEIPETETVISVENLKFVVKEMRRHKIRWVELVIKN